MADVIRLLPFYWVPVDYAAGSATRAFRWSATPLEGHRNPTVAEFDSFMKFRGHDDLDPEPRPTDAVSYVYARTVVKRIGR